ncbi:MAG: phosphate-starvation-inducible protein PsiE [Erythrobacter sp.]
MAEPEKTASHLESRAFVWAERVLLIVAAAMTFVAAGAEVVAVWERGTVQLADILLMFLYTEVIGMIAVFYSGKGSFFIYPIFIAITAIARLIVLQGKDMDPLNVVYEAGAILLLCIAAVVLSRARRE